jgi:hypothetical protein
MPPFFDISERWRPNFSTDIKRLSPATVGEQSLQCKRKSGRARSTENGTSASTSFRRDVDLKIHGAVVATPQVKFYSFDSISSAAAIYPQLHDSASGQVGYGYPLGDLRQRRQWVSVADLMKFVKVIGAHRIRRRKNIVHIRSK